MPSYASITRCAATGLPRLVDGLSKAHAFNNRYAFLHSFQLREARPAHLDDSSLAPLSGTTQRDPGNPRRPLRQEINDPHQPSTGGELACLLGDLSVADVILNWLVYNTYQLTLTGDSTHIRVTAPRLTHNPSTPHFSPPEWLTPIGLPG